MGRNIFGARVCPSDFSERKTTNRERENHREKAKKRPNKKGLTKEANR